MNAHASLEARLDALARMLPPWLATLRHPAQFWPQFEALAGEILRDADAVERAYVRQRLQAMLEVHAPDLRPPVPAEGSQDTH